MALTGKRRRRVRHLLAQRQRFRCCYCKRSFTGQGPSRATIEHVKPKRDGGKNNIENLAAACQHCNQHRGRQIHESRRARIKAAIQKSEQRGETLSPGR